MEDVKIELKLVDFAPPAPPLDLSAFIPASRCCFCLAPVGWYGDWHPDPHRQFFLVLSGKLEIEVSDGEVRRFEAGDILLVEDTTGKGHRSRVVGEEDLIGAFVQL